MSMHIPHSLECLNEMVSRNFQYYHLITPYAWASMESTKHTLEILQHELLKGKSPYSPKNRHNHAYNPCFKTPKEGII